MTISPWSADKGTSIPLWARVAGLLALVAVTAYLRWSRSPEVLAQRLCARRYHASRTAADSAALDSMRTMGRGGVVAPYTCGELSRAGKLD